jgi:DNA-binding CsgD family transcriptional regulator
VDVATVTASAGLGSVLSRREREVMHCAAQGMTNAQIAAELAVSTHAVKFHLGSIYRKLGVANRTEATARYVTALAGSNRPGVS